MPDDRNLSCDHGYKLYRNLLEQNVLEDLFSSIQVFFDGCFESFSARYDIEELSGTFRESSLSTRLSILLGVDRRSLMNHVEPILDRKYCYASWLPNPYLKEIFDIATSGPILKAVSSALDGDVRVLSHRLFFRLGMRDRLIMAQVRRQFGVESRHEVPEGQLLRCLGEDSWRMHALSFPPQTRGSKTVDVWVPVSSLFEGNGAVKVIDASHQYGLRRRPHLSERNLIRTLSLSPGDILIINGNLFQANEGNRVDSTECAWGIVITYVKDGSPIPFSYMPSFLCDTESFGLKGLEDSDIWSKIWIAALTHFQNHMSKTLSAREILYHHSDFERWHRYHQNPKIWLSVKERPNARRRREIFVEMLKKISND